MFSVQNESAVGVRKRPDGPAWLPGTKPPPGRLVPAAASKRYVSVVSLERFGASFARADSYGAFAVVYEDLAVADLAAPGLLDDGVFHC